MFCSKCGRQLPDEAKFCAGCGNQMSQPQSQNQPTQSSEQIVQPPVQPVQQPQPFTQQPQPTPSKSQQTQQLEETIKKLWQKVNEKPVFIGLIGLLLGILGLLLHANERHLFFIVFIMFLIPCCVASVYGILKGKQRLKEFDNDFSKDEMNTIWAIFTSTLGIHLFVLTILHAITGIFWLSIVLLLILTGLSYLYVVKYKQSKITLPEYLIGLLKIIGINPKENPNWYKSKRFVVVSSTLCIMIVVVIFISNFNKIFKSSENSTISQKVEENKPIEQHVNQEKENIKSRYDYCLKEITNIESRLNKSNIIEG